MIEIVVTDFQSIGHAELKATGLTVVVGPSNRGKSALLRAIEGVLFNKPGDQFVRRGAAMAAVTVAFSGHTVSWVKGAGANRFTIDGVGYSKVGVKAPDPLQALGFREVVIGARQKDDGRMEGGETLRPQVARQFGSDQIFLLDRPGTFVNELMVRLSRLGVLQRAGRACGLDLKQRKGLLKVRETDLTEAVADRQQLDPIVGLRDRVAALMVQREGLQQRLATQQQLRRLVAQRAKALSLSTLTLPDVAQRPFPLMTQVETLRPLVQRRQRVAVLPALPAPRTVKPALIKVLQQWEALRPLTIGQRQARNWVEQAETVAERRGDEVTAYQLDLSKLKLQVMVCPTCERPF